MDIFFPTCKVISTLVNPVFLLLNSTYVHGSGREKGFNILDRKKTTSVIISMKDRSIINSANNFTQKMRAIKGTKRKKMP